jgi:hypothetical protein
LNRYLLLAEVTIMDVDNGVNSGFVRAMKPSICVALSLGIVLLGCAADAPPAVVATSSNALTCEPFDESYCDPAYDCDVGAQYVQCNDGVVMFAWMTPDCRWCIHRDVCDGHGGPTACPF